MGTEQAFETLSLTNQVVLLGVVELHRDGNTPVQTHELRHVCTSQLEHVDTEVVGTITEADVMRSLYRLEDEGFVEEVEIDGTSPTGKGRPAYALSLTPDDIRKGIDDSLLEDE